MGEQQVEAAAPSRCVEQLASGRALCGLGSVRGGAFGAKAAYRLKAGVVSAARRQQERERQPPRHHRKKACGLILASSKLHWGGIYSGRHAQTYDTRVQSKIHSLAKLHWEGEKSKTSEVSAEFPATQHMPCLARPL